MNGFIDLTPVIAGVIALLAAVLTAVLVPWLKSRLTDAQMEELLAWVEIAVAAAQQLFHQLNGAERLDYALSFLAERGFDVDDAAVLNAVEAAVLKLHRQLEGAANDG